MFLKISITCDNLFVCSSYLINERLRDKWKLIFGTLFKYYTLKFFSNTKEYFRLEFSTLDKRGDEGFVFLPHLFPPKMKMIIEIRA